MLTHDEVKQSADFLRGKLPCGVPFMAAKGSGITEYIREDDFDNWVIEPHDYKSLAQNICRYMNHREKQTLKYSVDINELIKPFINYLMSR